MGNVEYRIRVRGCDLAQLHTRALALQRAAAKRKRRPRPVAEAPPLAAQCQGSRTAPGASAAARSPAACDGAQQHPVSRSAERHLLFDSGVSHNTVVPVQHAAESRTTRLRQPPAKQRSRSFLLLNSPPLAAPHRHSALYIAPRPPTPPLSAACGAAHSAAQTSLISLICWSRPPIMSYVESGTFSTFIRLTSGSTLVGSRMCSV